MVLEHRRIGILSAKTSRSGGARACGCKQYKGVSPHITPPVMNRPHDTTTHPTPWLWNTANFKSHMNLCQVEVLRARKSELELSVDENLARRLADVQAQIAASDGAEGAGNVEVEERREQVCGVCHVRPM